MNRAYAWLGGGLALLALAPGMYSQPAAVDDTHRREQLVALEHEWLTARDASTLERVLADDFLHPVPQGVFLSKAEHIDWFRHHPPAADRRERFLRLDVRIYGAVGVVTGIVETTGHDGKASQSIFTDVFVERDGRWQAVNAQENVIPGRSSAG